MKKIYSIFLVVILCFVFGACSQNGAGNSANMSSENPVAVAKEKLAKAYELYGKEKEYVYYDITKSYAELSPDGMTLIVDSNYMDSKAYKYANNIVSAIFSINNYLSLPSSVKAKMENTRSIDGVQSQDCGIYTVTWSYHPENGLEVIYEINE